MNYCVHTIMYGYFALRAARILVPRSLQQLITLLQLIQMIIGCVVNVAAFYYKLEGYSCATSNVNIVISLAMYASYLLLFAHFFYTTYLSKNSMKKSKDRTD
jgi:elongation of very long chain fatty acids protein 6